MTDPVALHHVDEGPRDAPALVLSGSLGSTLEMWRPQLPALTERFRVVRIDHRGHGGSPVLDGPYVMADLAGDVLALLDRLGLDRVDVAGHSFGGAIAVHLARTAPERVRRLVLLDPAIGLDPQKMLENAEETCEDESYADRAEARADRARRWEGIADALVEAELAEHLVLDGERYRYRYSPASVVAAWGEMARAAVPPPAGTRTLVLPASKADIVGPAWLAACREELDDALTVAEVDAGHMLYLERTAEVAAHTAAFLAG